MTLFLCADQPSAELTGPSTVTTGEVSLFSCSSPGRGEVAWTISSQEGVSLQPQQPTTTQTGDRLESVLEVFADPSHQLLTITCTVTNLAGESSSDIIMEIVGQFL